MLLLNMQPFSYYFKERHEDKSRLMYIVTEFGCRFLVDGNLKVAIELTPNPYTKEELEGDVVRPVRFVPKEEITKKVRCLMHEAEGECVRKNMQNLRMKSREAGAVGGSSRRNFEAYVHLLHKSAH